MMNTVALFFDISPFSWLHIISAIIAGMVIGIERQTQGKPIGIRTSILIIMSTYAFVVLAKECGVESGDNGRIVGQICAGIGFLGAGVILSRNGVVTGVTSAAVIWVLATIGITIALGHYYTAIKISFLSVAILLVIDKVEHYFRILQRGVHNKHNELL